MSNSFWLVNHHANLIIVFINTYYILYTYLVCIRAKSVIGLLLVYVSIGLIKPVGKIVRVIKFTKQSSHADANTYILGPISSIIHAALIYNYMLKYS